MAYDETLAQRIRELLPRFDNMEEKAMFGGLCFMIDDKMCVGVVKDELMCRLHPDLEEELLQLQGARPMDFTRTRMRGFLFVDESGYAHKDDLQFWINHCLDYNKIVEVKKKKPKKAK
jgi:TfoX/Sxy family transcriptional regulator of competence genes